MLVGYFVGMPLVAAIATAIIGTAVGRHNAAVNGARVVNLFSSLIDVASDQYHVQAGFFGASISSSPFGSIFLTRVSLGTVFTL